MKQTIKIYAKKFNITNFTKMLHYPIIPTNLVPFIIFKNEVVENFIIY